MSHTAPLVHVSCAHVHVVLRNSTLRDELTGVRLSLNGVRVRVRSTVDAVWLSTATIIRTLLRLFLEHLSRSTNPSPGVRNSDMSNASLVVSNVEVPGNAVKKGSAWITAKASERSEYRVALRRPF